MRKVPGRFGPVLALLGGLVVAWAVSSCGSGGSGTVAQQAKAAATTAASQVETATVARTTPERERTTTAQAPSRTVTEPAKTVTQTETVTEPARTVTQPTRTVTQTETVLQQTQTSTVGAIAVLPTATTADESNGDDFPWWGWALVLLGIAGVIFAIFQLGRRHGKPAAGEPDATTGSDPPDVTPSE